MAIPPTRGANTLDTSARTRLPTTTTPTGTDCTTMTTQLVRETMKMVADSGLDPIEMHWFDATGCFQDQTEESQQPLHNCRPPFEKCMVCWEGKSRNHQRMRMWLLVAGNDPQEGILLAASRQPANQPPISSPVMIYMIDDGQIRYGPVDEGVSMDKIEAEMILGFVSAWYESMSQRTEAYVPTVAPTFTNKRKIAQGKMPAYDWTTVVIQATATKAEHKGGTHASPRQHDRRGHLRRLRSGKNVWVKPHKVGDPNIGIIFHDYQIGERDGNS